MGLGVDSSYWDIREITIRCCWKSRTGRRYSILVGALEVLHQPC